MRRTIERAAFNASAAQLFDPANRIIGQEGDLFSRMGAAVSSCGCCINVEMANSTWTAA